LFAASSDPIDSVEKHKPASDIEHPVVKSLKGLDPNRGLEKRISTKNGQKRDGVANRPAFPRT